MNTDRAITIANDGTLIELISRAQVRLLVLAPGLSKPVAECLAQRWRDLGPDQVTVILDIDPEVYRLGYGDFEALQLLDGVASEVGGILQRQPGIRIGLVLADGKTLVYSPTPKLIDAGPSSPQTPNAVLLDAPPAKVLAELGQGENGVKDQVVGLDNAQRRDIEAVSQDLQQNPPQKFDIAQVVRVFNAKFEFVDFELLGTQIDRKTVRIPKHLSGIADEKTMEQFQQSFRILPPDSKLSGEKLRQDRELIARKYVRSVKGYGAVILRKDKDAFQKEVDQLRSRVTAFSTAVKAQLQEEMNRNRATLVEAMLQLVKQNPPKDWIMSDGEKPDEETVRRFLDHDLAGAFGKADTLVRNMEVRLVFKGVTYESLVDEKFLEAAFEAIPEFEQIYEEFEAARGRTQVGKGQ